jgi:Ran GTPase-activating protein (RanGAP) involved in mRNA processing and transport
MVILKVRSDVAKQIETVVDFANFNLSNEAFRSLLPVLEVKFFGNMTELDLSGNAIDDSGVLDLCDAMLNSHVTKLRILRLLDTKITDKGVAALIDLMRYLVRLDTVELSPLADVSK